MDGSEVDTASEKFNVSNLRDLPVTGNRQSISNCRNRGRCELGTLQMAAISIAGCGNYFHSRLPIFSYFPVRFHTAGVSARIGTSLRGEDSKSCMARHAEISTMPANFGANSCHGTARLVPPGVPASAASIWMASLILLFPILKRDAACR